MCIRDRVPERQGGYAGGVERLAGIPAGGDQPGTASQTHSRAGVHLRREHRHRHAHPQLDVYKRQAYNKTANAVPFSEVRIDRETGEIHVCELVFPEGYEPEVGEEEGQEIDTSMAERVEVTPDDFGRIAAQTAKQVIYQRIRERCV